MESLVQAQSTFHRRRLLEIAAGWAAGAVLPAAAAESLAGRWNAEAFAATRKDAALNALGIEATPTPDERLTVDALDLVEDGAVVEIGLRALLAPAIVRQLFVFVDHNPNALIAAFDFVSDSIEPALTLRIKMAESDDVQLVAVTEDGHAFSAKKHVNVTQGGCGDDGSGILPAPTPPQPTRIRAALDGHGGASVRMLMRHEMESGQRKDSAGRPIPAWHIATVTIAQNGQPVLTAQWGPAVSKDPYLQLRLRNARRGDRVGVNWLDNRGAKRHDEAVVS